MAAMERLQTFIEVNTAIGAFSVRQAHEKRSISLHWQQPSVALVWNACIKYENYAELQSSYAAVSVHTVDVMQVISGGTKKERGYGLCAARQIGCVST